MYCKALFGGFFCNYGTMSACCGDNSAFFEGDKVGNFSFNADVYNKMRKGIVSGNIPDYCKTCTAKGGYDMIEGSCFERNVNEMNKDGSINNYGIVSMTYMITDKCNSACRICGQHNSTLYRCMVNDEGCPYSDESSEYSRFEKIYKEHKGTIRNISLLGGEVMLSRYFDKYIDLIDESCFVTIYTNGIIYNEDKIKLLEKFNHSMIVFSIDGAGDSNEYMRPNCNFDDIVNKLVKCSNRFPNITMTINSTFSVYNIREVKELYLELFKYDKYIGHYSVNAVNNLSFLNINNLTKEELDYAQNNILELLISDEFNSLNKFKVNHLRGELRKLISQLYDNGHHTDENIKQLIEHNERHDKYFNKK